MSEQIPFVDVIVLSWNRSESTIATLQNILAQEGVFPEIWVIDQGSEKNEIEKLSGFTVEIKQIHLLKNDENIGVPAGRNQGMKLGHHDFIFCIDNDAIFETKKALSSAIHRFEQDRNIAVIGFKIKLFTRDQLDYGSWVYPKPLLNRQDEEFNATRFCGAGHAIRRSSLEETSYYDESLFFYWEELDLSYKLINLGYKIIYFPEVTVLHKVSDENRVSWNNDRFYFLVRNALYLHWKYYRSGFQFFLMAMGYLIKSFRNKIVSQAWRGIIEAQKMCISTATARTQSLSGKSLAYIREYDIKPRGNIVKRIKFEILGELPGKNR
jgi:GT2 family glycosyltransferase